MKTFILIACVLLSVSASAQQFVKTFAVDLPDSAASVEVEWVDLDNDGLLDVFAFATLPSGQHFFITYKMDTVQGLMAPVVHNTGFTAAVYHLTDFDRDNDIDVIVSGQYAGESRTTLFENHSPFHFAQHSFIATAATCIHFADLNANGPGELILSGNGAKGPFFQIYQFGTSWKIRNDSLQIEASSIEIFDFDGDSDNDIFVSGSENTVNTSKVLLNQGGFWFTTSTPLKVANGKTSVGDLNHDGALDIFLTGINTSGQNASIQYLNTGGSFVASDTLTPLSDAESFLADFNSDGKCDIHRIGKNNFGDTVNVIFFRDSVVADLNHTNLHDQTFGDFDRDGDLDLLQVLKGSAGLQIGINTNEVASRNLGPIGPSSAFGFTIFNKLFLYWTKALDDHTPAASLTYDVTIFQADDELAVGEFDIASNKRLTVSHGNAGTRNYMLIKPKAVTAFSYAVQSVDNAYESFRNADDPRNPGLCVGTGSPCASQQIIEVAACKNEILTFTAGADSQWFSLSKGLLADGGTFNMKAVAADTVFSFDMEKGCPSLTVYLIQLRGNVIKKTSETRFVCEGQSVPLSVQPGWTSIQWKSLLRGDLGKTGEITYTVTQNDTITVQAMNESGCGIQHKTALRVSKPVFTLAGEIYQILKGESVQLSASGGEKYRWSPDESLSNDTVPDPIASPLTSTNYSVTVSDSIGCSAVATVQVMVEGTAFIPNLFTPNNDGKNDEVKVYGLLAVSNFSLVIHNREGNILYETNDANQATASGWDGTANGVKQPAGVYYWKVKGQHPSGRKLLLNGKATGSIVLIR